MKKLLLIVSLITIAIISCSLCACNKDNDKNFFSKSVLADNLVPDLPRIKCEKAEKEYSKVYRFKTTEEAFNDYVVNVYDYLSSLNFEYFGYRGKEISNFFGGAPEYEFYFGSELSEFKYTEDRSGHKLENCYVFVWANEIRTEAPNKNVLKDHYLEICYFSDGRELNVYIDLNFGLETYRLVET